MSFNRRHQLEALSSDEMKNADFNAYIALF